LPASAYCLTTPERRNTAMKKPYLVRYYSHAGLDSEGYRFLEFNSLTNAEMFAKALNGKVLLNKHEPEDHWDIEAGIEQWREERDSEPS
jgi:hypothetical protein